MAYAYASWHPHCLKAAERENVSSFSACLLWTTNTSHLQENMEVGSVTIIKIYCGCIAWIVLQSDPS